MIVGTEVCFGIGLGIEVAEVILEVDSILESNVSSTSR
jgi:hypothetical protein